MNAAIHDGIVLGLSFGLLGVGLTLVYGLGGVLNLAHGQIAVLGAIVASHVMADGIPTVLAALSAVAVAATAGVALDMSLMPGLPPEARAADAARASSDVGGRLPHRRRAQLARSAWRPVHQRQRKPGLDCRGADVARKHLGLCDRIGRRRSARALLRGHDLRPGRSVRDPGRDGRATRRHQPYFVRTIIFALSGGLAGLVAVTRSMTGPVTVNAGFDLTIFALIVTVVGGLGSVAGAFLAGVLLGIVETISAYYIGQYITTMVLLGAAALTILVRPRGLLGR